MKNLLLIIALSLAVCAADESKPQQSEAVAIPYITLNAEGEEPLVLISLKHFEEIRKSAAIQAAKIEEMEKLIKALIGNNPQPRDFKTL